MTLKNDSVARVCQHLRMERLTTDSAYTTKQCTNNTEEFRIIYYSFSIVKMIFVSVSRQKYIVLRSNYIFKRYCTWKKKIMIFTSKIKIIFSHFL
jgi:hypothetical protein